MKAAAGREARLQGDSEAATAARAAAEEARDQLQVPPPLPPLHTHRSSVGCPQAQARRVPPPESAGGRGISCLCIRICHPDLTPLLDSHVVAVGLCHCDSVAGSRSLVERHQKRRHMQVS